jgi:hypothetical protein
MNFHEIGNSGNSWGPTHRSHKLVAARKILAIQNDSFDNQAVTRFIFEGVPSVTVTDTELQNKPKPEAGMYLVVYAGGYFSFSPAKEFEEGYRAEPQTFQERVHVEKKELDDKISKLHEFVHASPIFQTVPADEQERLSRQLGIMHDYSGVLDERIHYFPK